MCKNDKEKFKKYYYKYLNYTGNKKIVCSKDRDKSINDLYYPVIIGKIDDETIYSINSKEYEKLKLKLDEEKSKNKKYIIKIINVYFEDKKEKVVIQEMIRMSKTNRATINISEVISIDDKYSEAYFNSFEYNKDIEYKEKKWEKIKKYKYINGIVKENKIVSLGFVSNINYNGANIVIQTKEKYRNKGYGKSIVEKISIDLLKDGIMPIYWVNEENNMSKKLAKSIGFEEEAREIVVKYKK